MFYRFGGEHWWRTTTQGVMITAILRHETTTLRFSNAMRQNCFSLPPLGAVNSQKWMSTMHSRMVSKEF